MLELAVLGLLRDGAHHGYELKRLLADLGFWSVSFGSLYPALRRLERRDLIEAQVSSDKRRRKVYRITDEGDDYFQDLMRSDDTSTADDDRSFRLRLAFFEYLDPDRRLPILERRRHQIIEERDRMKRRLGRNRERAKARGDRYRLAVLEHGLRRAEADLAWIDELIMAERTAPDGFSPGVAPEMP